MSTPFRLLLPRQIYNAMIAQAQAELPNECCGKLGGRLNEDATIANVEQMYPMVNAAASPREYLSEGKSLVAASKDMRHKGLEELAVYHSHPATAPVPSRKDLELCRELGYSHVVHFIISLRGDSPLMRGWWLLSETYLEADWQVTE